MTDREVCENVDGLTEALLTTSDGRLAHAESVFLASVGLSDTNDAVEALGAFAGELAAVWQQVAVASWWAGYNASLTRR